MSATARHAAPTTPSRAGRLARLLAVVVLIGGVLVPATAAGASSCNLLSGLLGGCNTSAAQIAPAGGCSGEDPIKSGNTHWSCTFDDEFNGTSLNRSLWTVQVTSQHGFHSGNACAVDNSQNISESGGHLNLTVRRVAPMVCASPSGSFATSYTEASLYTKVFAQQYGRFEVRAKFAQSNGQSGVQGALWMYPRTVTASSILSGATEIDIAEAYSHFPNYVSPTVHAFTAVIGNTKACTVTNFGAAFHTYGVTWSPSSITFTYDGATCLRVASPLGLPGAFGGQPFLIALSQGLGMGHNLPSSATPMPSTEQIDYVRAWK